jgi:hypothetical protein
MQSVSAQALGRPFSVVITVGREAREGHGAPAITASISQVSRGTFVMFLHPCAVTYCNGTYIVSMEMKNFW